jgi:hypothetical protein
MAGGMREFARNYFKMDAVPSVMMTAIIGQALQLPSISANPPPKVEWHREWHKAR